MNVNWPEVWVFLWPILREGLIALLISILGLMGYDKIVPSRYARRSGDPKTPEGFVYSRHAYDGELKANKVVEGLHVGRRG